MQQRCSSKYRSFWRKKTSPPPISLSLSPSPFPSPHLDIEHPRRLSSEGASPLLLSPPSFPCFHPPFPLSEQTDIQSIFNLVKTALFANFLVLTINYVFDLVKNNLLNFSPPVETWRILLNWRLTVPTSRRRRQNISFPSFLFHSESLREGGLNPPGELALVVGGRKRNSPLMSPKSRVWDTAHTHTHTVSLPSSPLCLQHGWRRRVYFLFLVQRKRA